MSILHAESVGCALVELGATSVDVVIIRWAQVPVDAVDMVRAIRRCGDHTPIAIYDPVTRSELEIARILDTGADDFITAPELRPNELLARLRALQRRRPFAATRQISVGRITLDIERREASVDGVRVDLTIGDYRLLSYLARRPGACVTKRELYLSVLETQDRDNSSNALPAAIHRLRQKLGSAAHQLVAVTGVGYRRRRQQSKATTMTFRAN